MRIKLDENLPGRLVPVLTELGHDTDTVIDERLAGQDDGVVWEAVQADARFLVTHRECRKFEGLHRDRNDAQGACQASRDLMPDTRHADLVRFYEILDALEHRIGVRGRCRSALAVIDTLH